jgi:glycosyltransferase involved in cell wall biosynthesis
MKLSIVIPCYNESYNERNTILPVIAAVKAAPFDDKEIIVVDCSSDGTREVLRRDIEPALRGVDGLCPKSFNSGAAWIWDCYRHAADGPAPRAPRKKI